MESTNTDNDTDTGQYDLALVTWREARGEGSIEALRAVMHVILNRMKAWGQSMHRVIYGKNQFTSMQDKQHTVFPKPDDQVWETCLGLAVQVMNKDYPDPDLTDGALYYENPATATSPWFVEHCKEWKKTVQIGHHIFYKP